MQYVCFQDEYYLLKVKILLAFHSVVNLIPTIFKIHIPKKASLHIFTL